MKKEEKPENPINKIMKKKVEDYEEIIKLIDELTEYLKPIVGEDNEEVNKRLHKIRFKVSMMPMTDLIQTTVQSSLGIFMAGKKLGEYQEEFNETWAKSTGKDFEKFIKGKK